jgi:hypothetical protein
MGPVEYFRSALKNLHNSLADCLKGLTSEQLHFRPLGKGTHLTPYALPSVLFTQHSTG